MKENLQNLSDLSEKKNKLQTDWYRQILTLSSGGLAILVAFRPEIPPDGFARYLLAATWLFLGLGIVSGSAAIYWEADLSKRILNSFREELLLCLRENVQMPLKPIVVSGNKFYWLCRGIMTFSLLIAVSCLVGYAILTTLKV